MVKHYDLIHKNGYLLGVATYAVSYSGGAGWKFFPNVTSHNPSRVPHPTALACLPPWAKRHLKRGASFLPREAPTQVVLAPVVIGESKITSQQVEQGLSKLLNEMFSTHLGRR